MFSFNGSIALFSSKTVSSICIFKTSHKTRLPAPPSCPKEITSFILHSKFIGDSFTLGGLTKSDFISVNPAFSNSFVSESKSQEDKETCCAISSVTTDITHSFCNTLSGCVLKYCFSFFSQAKN